MEKVALRLLAAVVPFTINGENRKIQGCW